MFWYIQPTFFTITNSKRGEIRGMCSKYERDGSRIKNCTVNRINANVCFKGCYSSTGKHLTETDYSNDNTY